MKRNAIACILPVSVLSLIAVLSGCSDQDGAREGLVGSAQVAVTSTPADVGCIRITAVGSRTITRPFDVTAGQSTVLSLGSLPVGVMTFSADAFSTACASVASGTAAPWVSDPVQATVNAGAPTTITLPMRRNGQVNVNVDFPADEGTANDAGAPRTDAAVPPGPVSFASTEFGLPSPVTAVVAGSLNQDGKIDLVLGSSGTPQLTVLRNNGNGTFGAPTVSPINAPVTALGLIDFNADHRLDLVAPLTGGALVTLQNDGAAFSLKATFTPPNPSTSIAVVDQGVVAGGPNAPQVSSVLVNAAGAMSLGGTLGVGGDASAGFASGDLNGDGKLDFVVAYPNQNMVGVFLAGSAAGGFTMLPRLQAASTPRVVAIGDVDGDGRADIAVGTTSQVLIFSRQGNATDYTMLANAPINGQAFAMGAADFNRDGRADVIVANPGNLQVVQVTTSNVQVTTVGPGASPPMALATGDFNGDGRPDVALVSANRPSVTLLTSN